MYMTECVSSETSFKQDLANKLLHQNEHQESGSTCKKSVSYHRLQTSFAE